MEKHQVLQNSQQVSSLTIPITEPCDLLKCKPILTQVKEHGQDKVIEFLSKSVLKCANQLTISTTDDFIRTLCEDLIDKYNYDSLEDILECLKKGRQGYYGTNYHKLNMIVISEWMGHHLEEKAKAREKFYQDRKDQPIEDFEEYHKRNKERQVKKLEEGYLGALENADRVIHMKLKK